MADNMVIAVKITPDELQDAATEALDAATEALDALIEWLRENRPRVTAEMRLWTDGIGSLCDLLGGEV